jgi:hypothetical protein
MWDLYRLIGFVSSRSKCDDLFEGALLFRMSSAYDMVPGEHSCQASIPADPSNWKDNGARSPRFRKLSKQMNIVHFWLWMLVWWSVLRSRKSDEMMELYLTLVRSSVGLCLGWYVAGVLSMPCCFFFVAESTETQEAVIEQVRALTGWGIQFILWSFKIPIEIALWVRRFTYENW